MPPMKIKHGVIRDSLSFMVLVLADGDTEIEFYETEAEAMDAAREECEVDSDGMQIFVLSVVAQGQRSG